MFDCMRRIGAAALVAAAVLATAPAAEAQLRGSWGDSYFYSTGYRGLTPYYAGRVPYAPYGTGYYGGVQWHTAPSYYYWTGPGYNYTWRNPGTSVYYGPGYYYQYYW